MSYIAYSGLKTPNEVISKMYEYIQTRGYNIVQSIVDDLNIYNMSNSDGKRFAFADRTGDYFINLRSANGTQIFGVTDDATMDATAPELDENYTGVGMIVSEGYTSVGRWYNQYKIPHKHNSNEICCVFLPMKVNVSYKQDYMYYNGDVVSYNNKIYKVIADTSESGVYMGPTDTPDDATHLNISWQEVTGEELSEVSYSYTLYCNNITSPTDTIVFTLKKENDTYRQCAHLVYANIDKYEIWSGGALFSGSATKAQIKDPEDPDRKPPVDMMKVANKCFEHELEADKYILPVLSSGETSNTFLRANIDGAPSEVRGEILWASSGTDNITGKKMSLPIRVGQNMNGQIPNYLWLQSRARLDWGRNINTINSITIDMPMFVAVLVDPDALDNYAAVGEITGIYCISTLNTQTGGLYERSYPTSGQLDQTFPHGKRRGHYGFDGISIKQEI